jgi:predicted DNA-binding antitoxin AbrB/MazE fold protein
MGMVKYKVSAIYRNGLKPLAPVPINGEIEVLAIYGNGNE